jgi:hypothetical protein
MSWPRANRILQAVDEAFDSGIYTHSVQQLQIAHKKVLAIESWGTAQLPQARKHKINEYIPGTTGIMQLFDVGGAGSVCFTSKNPDIAKKYMDDLYNPRLALKRLLPLCRQIMRKMESTLQQASDQAAAEFLHEYEQKEDGTAEKGKKKGTKKKKGPRPSRVFEETNGGGQAGQSDSTRHTGTAMPAIMSLQLCSNRDCADV